MKRCPEQNRGGVGFSLHAEPTPPARTNRPHLWGDVG